MRDARIEKFVIGVCIHRRGWQLQYADYIFPVKYLPLIRAHECPGREPRWVLGDIRVQKFQRLRT
jgi:hypothetical protein